MWGLGGPTFILKDHFMSGASPELLVVLDSPHAASALAELLELASVTQVLGPRLALVRADAATAARIAKIKGVHGVHSGTLGGIPSDLTQKERAFVSAWEMRQRPKERPGDGLSWDAPGFTPPDPPGGKR
jgi:hypothetical protein